MTTHRSMNKMELRAHTSVHNLVDVKEEEALDTENFTRDRLGKRQSPEAPALEVKKSR